LLRAAGSGIRLAEAKEKIETATDGGPSPAKTMKIQRILSL